MIEEETVIGEMSRSCVIGVTLLLLLFDWGCGGSPVITGMVLDNLGNPVSGATVRIDVSTLQAKTDDTGRYELTFVPGQFKVLFSKDDHVSNSIELNIAVAQHFPAQDVILFRIPREQGVSAVMGGKYVPLEKTPILVEIGGENMPGVPWSMQTTLIPRVLSINPTESVGPILESGERVFVMPKKALTLVQLDPNGLIGSQVVSTTTRSIRSQEGFRPVTGPSRDQGPCLEYTCTLEEGRFAFIDAGWTKEGNFAYPFQVFWKGSEEVTATLKPMNHEPPQQNSC